MTSPPVVSNSSAIIALDQVGHLHLLQQLFGSVRVPTAVLQETAPLTLPNWIIEHPVTQPIGSQVLSARLGAGESEAISLAVELSARWLILDDRPARRLAQALGLPLIGTLGLLLVAKRRGLIPVLRPILDMLAQRGFYVSSELYHRVVADAGEAP